jgi:hypothetical protein
MTITLNRSYAGYASGTIVSLDTTTEAALIAQGLASLASSAASAPTATGAVTANVLQGRATVAAAASSVVITNSLVNVNSKIVAYINQAAADGTAFNVTRIVPAVGSFTIFLNAATTANTVVDWVIIMPSGEFPNY